MIIRNLTMKVSFMKNEFQRQEKVQLTWVLPKDSKRSQIRAALVALGRLKAHCRPACC